ncbi:MAG TPA: S24 family peptidase [Promineifilum sp.]|jgi:DNA polymerase V|nr:S24 family peptidase [Promineifilum sp.]
MQRTIPITVSTGDASPSACDGSESFALMVLGDAMLPEFAEGEIVVIEPNGQVENGSFVLARVDDDWTLRQLCRKGDDWTLCALNPDYPEIRLGSLEPVRGVVIQRVRPGRRRDTKFYVD